MKAATCLYMIWQPFNSSLLHFVLNSLLSPQCQAKVREAFAAVEAALMAGNTSQVAKDFDCCQIPSAADDQVMDLFLRSVWGKAEY